MPVKLDCPRCNRPLSVPSKKIGRYANCPRCGGRFWVPENAAARPSVGHPQCPTDGMPQVEPDQPPSGMAGPAQVCPAGKPPQPADELASTISMNGTVAAPPEGVVSDPLVGQNSPATQETGPPPVPVGGDGSNWQVVPPPAPSAIPAPAVQPLDSSAKTARFISAEAAQSTLKLAEDGMLPELHLREGEQKEEQEAKTTTVNPLVLFGLLAISVAFSIGLVMLDVGPTEGRKKDVAREVIRTEFFSSLDHDQLPKPYQLDLREAQQAHTRGDRERERNLYQKVLNRLRREPAAGTRAKRSMWLTGSRDRDRRLQQQISILLSSD